MEFPDGAELHRGPSRCEGTLDLTCLFVVFCFETNPNRFALVSLVKTCFFKARKARQVYANWVS